MLVIDAKGKDAAYDVRLLVVYLEDAAAAERRLDDGAVIVVLAQVYVEYLEGFGGHGIQKCRYGCARYLAALCQRAETYAATLCGHPHKLLREGYEVPRHVAAYVVLWHSSIVERHLDRTGGVRYALHHVVEAALVELSHEIIARSIEAYGAHGRGVVAELRHVVCEVGGCTAYLASGGEHVPQRFAYSDYVSVLHCYKGLPR